MSQHSYSRCWLHLIWGTHRRARVFSPESAAQVSAYLAKYAAAKGIYHRINFVNTDHVHALIDLPTSMTIEQTVKLLKGASSHWINERNLVPGKFSWGRGYAALSVSQSGVADVSRYIGNQAEHHRVKSFTEEYRTFIERYGLQWREEPEETVETVSGARRVVIPAMNRGVNESGASAAPANKTPRGL
jgi:putative transposase